MAENSVVTPLQHVTSKGNSIICVLCKKTRCSVKYKRHLLMHFNNGEISRDEMQQIIFKKWITRCNNKSNTPSNRQRGHMCLFRDHLNNKCGRIVLNLARHLVSVHKMNRHCSKFEDLIAESLAVKPFEKYIRVEQTHKILPSISSSSVALMKTVSPQPTEHNIGFSIQRSSTPTHCRVELADKNSLLICIIFKLLMTHFTPTLSYPN